MPVALLLSRFLWIFFLKTITKVSPITALCLSAFQEQLRVGLPYTISLAILQWIKSSPLRYTMPKMVFHLPSSSRIICNGLFNDLLEPITQISKKPIWNQMVENYQVKVRFSKTRFWPKPTRPLQKKGNRDFTVVKSLVLLQKRYNNRAGF